jgi:hypothetical protein
VAWVHGAADAGFVENSPSEDAVDPFQKYPILSSLLSLFPKRHGKTLALVVACIVECGQARSMAIAQTMWFYLRGHLGSAWNRLYRLLRNPRVDDQRLVQKLARCLCRNPDKRLLLAIDWTEWHSHMRMLVAAAVIGKRAIPLWAQAFHQRVWRRSQNTRENTFLRVLVDTVRQAGLRALVLCDRGFRRTSWIDLLQKLEQGFVVRLMSDVHVELEPGLRVALRDVMMQMGDVVDLGVVPLRSDAKVLVRVIGYWAPGAHEPWWVATSETVHPRRVLKLYDRRMTVEEQLRDTKGQRFGTKLFWTRFRDPDRLARLFLLVAVALLLWTYVGFCEAHWHPSLRLRSRAKGPRQSYVTIGIRILARGWHAALLSFAAVHGILESPAFRTLDAVAVGGK